MSSAFLLSPAQCRAARGLLAWSQTELASAAGVGRATLADFERGAREPIGNNLRAIRRALEDAGVKFVEEGLGGVVLLPPP